MSDSELHPLPTGVGLWAGFLDRLGATEAVGAVTALEAAGVRTIWLQEFSGVDPFIRATLYLQATTELTVGLGVSTIHARDPEAMTAVSSTIEEALPGRFVLGLGTSHGHLVAARGHHYAKPLTAMRQYLADMDDAAGRRALPARVLGALGPRMTELAGTAAHGAHSYFAPVAHTAASRALVGRDVWLGPSQMVALTADPDWPESVRRYFGLCLGMPNYRRNLTRFGYGAAEMDPVSDALLHALVVADEPTLLRARLDEQFTAGANHVVIQVVPPPGPRVVIDRVLAGLEGLTL